MIYLAGLGMELCWLQVWSEFLMVSIFHYHVPILFTLIVYLSGALTWSFSWRKSRIAVQVALIYAVAFSASSVLALYGVFRPANGYPAELEVDRLLSPDKSPLEWFFAFVMVLVILIIWKRGTVSVSRPLNTVNMYHRFDLGIAALLTLLIVHSLMIHRFDLALANPLDRFQYIPFLLFGFLTIGAVMLSNQQINSRSSGLQKISIALAFSITVTAAGVGLVLLFQPQLTASAEAISSAARTTGRPIGAFFIWLIKLLWAPNRLRQETASGSSEKEQTGLNLTAESEEIGLWGQIFLWLMIGLSIIAALAVIYFLIKALIGLLMRRTAAPGIRKTPIRWLRWLNALIAVFQRLIVKCRNGLYLPVAAKDFHTILIKWGNASGVRDIPSETPQEYASRLNRCFPALKPDIDQLIDLIHLEIYGEKPLNTKQIEKARRACKSLSHPIHWPRRLYRLCFELKA